MIAATRGNNNNARAEQIYTLVAALQALRSAPELIFLRHQLTPTATATTATTTIPPPPASSSPSGMYSHTQSQLHTQASSTLPHPHPSVPSLRPKASASVAIDADILCDVFAAQLMAHRSTESLSTQSAATQPDGKILPTHFF